MRNLLKGSNRVGRYSPDNKSHDKVDGFLALSSKAILILSILSLILPLAALLILYGSVFSTLDDTFGDMSDLADARINGANVKNGITTNFQLSDLKNLDQRLQSITAPSSEAKLADRLHIIVINNNKNANSKITSDVPTSKSGTLQNRAARFIEMDISQIKKSAFVIITNRPTVFNFSEVQPNQRALFGYESKEAFDVIGADNGLLAGYLSEALTFFSSAEVNDFEIPISKKKTRRNYTACKTIKRWQDYFEVNRASIYIWKVNNTQKLKIQKFNILNNEKRISRPTPYSSFCQR